DDIVEKYMGHLAGEPLEEPVLGEIKEYEQRLKKRIGDNEVKDKELATVVEAYNYDWGVQRGEVEAEDYVQDDLHRIPNQAACFAEKPPFPLLDMYVDIVSILDPMVEEKTRSFVFNIIIKMGEKIKEGKWSTDVDYDRSEINRHALYYLVTDKRFMGLVNAIKSVFDTGCKHLIDAGK
ncbi:MAG: hypothetical protein WBF33_03115, partial [Candidatus Nitrosopolaris sp.]